MQKLESLKLTMVTRNMVNSVISFGIRIGKCRIESGNIRQGYYPKIPQCTFCQKFHKSECNAEHTTCPCSAQTHRRFECKARNKFKCSNCLEGHKATSNYCENINQYLTSAPIPDSRLENLVCLFRNVCQDPAQQQDSFDIHFPNDHLLRLPKNGTDVLGLV